jgi:hypothetical protein
MIWLQTFPRLFGFVFNPVSFFLCHDRAGAARGAGRGQQHLRRDPALPAAAPDGGAIDEHTRLCATS